MSSLPIRRSDRFQSTFPGQSFSIPQAISILDAVLSGLAAAHEAGIVHRDLKPANIFLVKSDDDDVGWLAKVLDFGIAKLKAGGGNPALTKAGTVLGTPSYMSPEQCKGVTELDARSDIYSLAVVLYQALTGKLPFTSDSIMEVMIAHVTTPPTPPIEHNPKLSPHLNDVLMKALESPTASKICAPQ